AIGLYAGIASALLERERTGIGSEVGASLIDTAAWVGGSKLVSLTDGTEDAEPVAPLTASYRCADGRFIMINLMQSDRYWHPFCEGVDAPALAADVRFADFAGRAGHPEELRAALEQLFLTRTL